MKKGYIIAVDGPSGSGKSTVSQRVAEKLDYLYLDTGAMYRAAALKAIRIGLNLDDEAQVARIAPDLDIELKKKGENLQVLLEGGDVSSDIRGPEMGMAASKVSRFKAVRDTLSRLQRKLGESGSVVAEGRDMGTVVFPDADYKFFVTAGAEERAKRRYQELLAKGHRVEYDSVLRDVIRRDEQDSKRELAPLKPAPDAEIIDTSAMDIGQVVDYIVSRIRL
jgi:CMP/dCMP kinase